MGYKKERTCLGASLDRIGLLVEGEELQKRDMSVLTY